MDTTIARDAIPQQTGSCVIRQQKEGYLFYNSLTDELHLMPKVAFLVFQLCDGLHTTAEIERWLMRAIPGDKQAAGEALDQFLEALITRGILEMAHDA